MKGSYLLLINVKKSLSLKVGKLGSLQFDRGSYVYVGSSMNNLDKRVERHLRSDKKVHWHVDYFLLDKNVEVVGVLKKPSLFKEECDIAKRIANKHVGVSGFGCSDCKCKSHLFKLENFRIL